MADQQYWYIPYHYWPWWQLLSLIPYLRSIKPSSNCASLIPNTTKVHRCNSTTSILYDARTENRFPIRKHIFVSIYTGSESIIIWFQFFLEWERILQFLFAPPGRLYLTPYVSRNSFLLRINNKYAFHFSKLWFLACNFC